MGIRALTLGAGLALLACSESTSGPEGEGTLLISVTTGGGDQDLDGYQLTLDGVPMPIRSGEEKQFIVGAGDHSLELGGVAANCLVGGAGAARTVAVPGGMATSVVFNVSCAVTGVRLEMGSTGLDVDRNGFGVIVDGLERGYASANGVLMISRLDPGEHTVALQDIAPNCQVQGDASQVVTVTNRHVTRLALQVVCAAASGAIRVQVTTTGEATDGRYRALLDGGTAVSVEVENGTGVLSPVTVGAHSVHLEDVRYNCAATDGNVREASVESSILARDTAVVDFAVECQAGEAAINVTLRVTGSDPDAHATVALWRSDCSNLSTCPETLVESETLSPDQTIAIPAASDGYRLRFQKESNCSEHSPTVTDWFGLGPGATANFEFEVSCGPSSISVTTTTTGQNLDTQYVASVYACYYYCYYEALERSIVIGANASISFDADPNRYRIRLAGVNSNCTVTSPNPGPRFTLGYGETHTQSFSVSCAQ